MITRSYYEETISNIIDRFDMENIVPTRPLNVPDINQLIDDLKSGYRLPVSLYYLGVLVMSRYKSEPLIPKDVISSTYPAVIIDTIFDDLKKGKISKSIINFIWLTILLGSTGNVLYETIIKEIISPV